MKKLVILFALLLIACFEQEECRDCGYVYSSISRWEKYGPGYKGYETLVEYDCGKELWVVRTTVNQIPIGTEVCNLSELK